MENDIYLENEIIENFTNENETIENILVEDTNIVTLETIHNDLGFICSFLIIAAIVIFITMLYKLFNMFF